MSRVHCCLPSKRSICRPTRSGSLLCAVLIAISAACDPLKRGASVAAETAPPPRWKSLFDGKTLQHWKSTEFGGQGLVRVKNGMIEMQQGSELTGITWTGEPLPKINYEISLAAQRIEGNDFFCGLTFPVNDNPCSYIIGGWGGGVVGISSLDGLDAANNDTTRYQTFEKGRWYRIRIHVTENGLMAWINEQQMIGVVTKGRKISIRTEVELSRPLGIACYSTVAGLKDVRIRELEIAETTSPITVPELLKADDL